MNKTIEKHRELLSKKAFAHLATLMPDGSPQVTPVWIDFDNEYLFVNSAKGRQKDLNMRRDPRVAISILDPDDPYQWIQIRGTVVEITEDGADDHIDQLAHKYLNVESYPFRTVSETRIIYTVEPL